MPFIIKKIIAAFIKPSGLAVIFFFCFSGLYFKKKRKKLAAVFSVTGLIFWLVSSKFFGSLLLFPLERGFHKADTADGDIIIVLSAGKRMTGNIRYASEAPSAYTLERLMPAMALSRKTGLKILLSGGGNPPGPSEALLMKETAEETGFPEEKLITEENSRDTWENAVYSKRLCDALGYKKPVLVTSAYHMPRAVYLFRKAGFSEIIPFPVSPNGDTYFSPRSVLPGDFRLADIAVNEYAGLVYSLLIRNEKI
mgnify:CR=1 FL=1